MNRPLVAPVVNQHAQDAVDLRHVRTVLVRAPHVQLHRLQRLDERLAAHLDGLWTAWPAASGLLEEALASPSAGVLFACTVMALQARDGAQLTRLVTLAATLPEAERGLLSALGWVSAEDLQGTVRALLGSQTPVHRAWGLTACAMHLVDPGAILAQAVGDADPQVRARAWRAAAQLGRRDLADTARQALRPPSGLVDDATQAGVRRAAAAALTLWGQGDHDGVREALLTPRPEQALPDVDAHRLATLAAPVAWGREQIRVLAAQAEASAAHKRRMMRMAGWVGDPQIVPWLIHHMDDDVWARLAGEAFSLITGADLASLGLERKPPEGIDFGPNADPEDENVALDEDDSLPWPDQARVQAWWHSLASGLPGGRLLAGHERSTAQALHVLRTQGQRQRNVAADTLCLLAPGSKRFPVAAPAWRQARWLQTWTA